MHILFVHQNFPAQFRYLAPRLVKDFGWRCTFATRNSKAPDVPGVERIVYPLRTGAKPTNHLCTRAFENEVGHAHGVYEALKERPDIRPDLLVAHSGFGSSLFLPHLYDAPVINFFELFYRPVGQCLGYRPDLPVDEPRLLRSRTSNATILLDLENCDAGWCPNRAQRDTFPPGFLPKLRVIPEGVDTALYRRTDNVPRRLPDGTEIPAGARVVTYVSRGFEMTRGFDIFLAAAKLISERLPDVLFVVVGTDRAHYGPDRAVTRGQSLRQRVMADGGFDPDRFRFTGWVPEAALAEILSMSDLHVYLTLPFITSWSMLDAMSCSCVVLASDQACTREYITHGHNGLLCDFFDAEGIANQAVDVLRDRAAHRRLGDAARRTIEEHYSLDVCLPRINQFFEEVVARGPRTPSMRAEALVRPAKPAAWVREEATRGGEGRAEPVVAPAPFDGAIPFVAHASCARQGAPRSGGGERCAIARHGQDAGATKTILFCWELGGGLGHLMQIRPLAEDLAKRGHRVFVALRELDRAVEVFGRAGVSYLDAPHAPTRAARCARAVGFAQLLANAGFADDNELFARACAWRNLVRLVRPDLVVCDHSPTALLAALAFPDVPRVVIGSGFCVPPDNARDEPWAALRPAANRVDRDAARTVESDVLGRVNWVLANWGRPPLERLARLYGGVHETLLTTLPELDHFRGRAEAGAAYWGPVLSCAAGGETEAPRWPAGNGRRVFAYLKASAAAEDVLRELKRAGCPTVAYVDGMTEATRLRLQAPTLQVETKRVDVAAASRECDLAVLNGGHGVTCEMLLAGKPVLAVPLVLEQQMTGDALKRLGAGESAPPRRGEPWDWAGRAKLEAMLSGDCYASAARRFADRYAAFDPARQREAMLRRAEGLLADESIPAGPSEVAREAELAAV